MIKCQPAEVDAAEQQQQPACEVVEEEAAAEAAEVEEANVSGGVWRRSEEVWRPEVCLLNAQGAQKNCWRPRTAAENTLSPASSSDRIRSDQPPSILPELRDTAAAVQHIKSSSAPHQVK